MDNDAPSHFRRALWRHWHETWAKAEIAADLDLVLNLEQGAWLPWALRAVYAPPDTGLELRCLDEAIRCGAGPDVHLMRIAARLRLNQLDDAERDCPDFFAPSITVPQPSWAHEPGEYALVLNADLADERLDVFHGMLQWIRGDFADAFLTLTSDDLRAGDRARIWAHLCQLGHGCTHALRPIEPQSVPLRPEGLKLRHHGAFSFRHIEMGPPQQQVGLWAALERLYSDQWTDGDLRIAAATALAAAESVGQLSSNGAAANTFQSIWPERHVWPSQVLFYVGMWHLQHGRRESAMDALRKASWADSSGSLERLAARAQLRRMELDDGRGRSPVSPLVQPPVPQSPLVDAFIQKSDASIGSCYPDGGNWLTVFGENLTDSGLMAMLKSEAMRGISSLVLMSVGITVQAIEAFHTSDKLANLRRLTLTNAPIGDEGLRSLVASPHLVGLESLTVGRLGLSDAGALILQPGQLPNLRSLTFTDALTLPVWIQLVDRFGDALHADVNPPDDLLKGVSPHLRVCLLSVAPPWFSANTLAKAAMQPPPRANPVPDSDGRFCELTFRMIDYLAFRWLRCGRESLGEGRSGRQEEIRELAVLQTRAEGYVGGAIRIDSTDGLAMVSNGFDPISLHCPACATVHERPVQCETRVDLLCRDRRVLQCPARHDLGPVAVDRHPDPVFIFGLRSRGFLHFPP